MNNYQNLLEILPEVAQALQYYKPIVALESTIISHGMPYPHNIETAILLEEIVRKNGAVPATIALLNGKIKVGLTREELEILAQTGLKVHKTSRRDLPYVISQKITGATTVSATMIIAQMAGIKIFATGGIGGVHRGANQTFDISADLQELSKTDVTVICAGVKSILDIGLTLEYLETMGVPVIGYKTDEMPAFYSSKSGFKVDFKLQSPLEIARFIKAKNDLQLQNGILVTQPVPEEFSIAKNSMDKIIDQALIQQQQKGIKGKETTPFLLAKVKELTGGESLISNIELVKNNAKLAAEIAVALSHIDNVK